MVSYQTPAILVRVQTHCEAVLVLRMRAVDIVQDAGFTPVEAANAEIYRLDNFLHPSGRVAPLAIA